MLNSIVSIESVNEDNDSFGTGFVIECDEKGVYILTCKHVIDDVQRPMVDEVIAKVIASSDFIDMAVLYVSKLQLQPLPMQVDPCNSLNVDVIGFSHFNQHLTQKKHIHSTLFQDPIELHSNDNNAFYRVRKIKANDNFHFDRGNSGSPVICKESGHVIAMVSNKEGKEIGYAIEIVNLEQVWKDIPPLLLEKGQFVHNHLPFDYGYKEKEKKKKEEPIKDELLSKKNKWLRYAVAGLITLAILTFTYIFFFSKPTLTALS